MPTNFAPTIESLRALKPLERFPGFGGVSLVVSQRTWPKDTSLEAVLDGSALPETIVATSDGRHLHTPMLWHEGPETGEWVYFERYTVMNGVLAMAVHGCIDPTTRKLLQYG